MAKKKEIKNEMTDEGIGPDLLKAAIPSDVSVAMNNEVLDELRKEVAAVPRHCQDGWEEHVMSQFKDGELADGRPKLNGLIRVSRKLLGPVINMQTKVVSPPDYSALTKPAVVEVALTFRFQEGEFEGEPEERTFSGVGDVWKGNCEEMFARFACSMAETRALARAYRQALGLSKAVADEMPAVPEFIEPEFIDEKQKTFMDIMAKACDINMEKFVDLGRKKYQYDTVDEIKYKTAGIMIDTLSDWKNDRTKIPAALKGYKADWRK